MSEIVPAVDAVSSFDAIRRVDAQGEYWMARELQTTMAYSRWESFEVPLNRAMKAAENTGADVTSNFQRSAKISATRSGVDYRLTRYAAYLVAMNGDPNKDEVARAQTYFAVKTRQAEVGIPQQRELSDDEKLVALAQGVLDLQKRVAIESGRADSAEHRAAELEPAAESWERLASGHGDRSLREAAHILSQYENVKIGQNQLAKLMRALGWVDKKLRPYQAQINNGRLAARLREWEDRDTGEVHTSYQARVRPKGLHALAGHLSGAQPLQLRLSLVDEDGWGDAS